MAPQLRGPKEEGLQPRSLKEEAKGVRESRWCAEHRVTGGPEPTTRFSEVKVSMTMTEQF